MSRLLQLSIFGCGALFATSAAAVEPAFITTFEQSGKISLLVGDDAVVPPSDILLPGAPADAPHVCSFDSYPSMAERMRQQG